MIKHFGGYDRGAGGSGNGAGLKRRGKYSSYIDGARKLRAYVAELNVSSRFGRQTSPYCGFKNAPKSL